MSEAARKDVVSCEEFTLYPDGRLDSAPEVKRALWRATLRISNRKGSEDRVDLAIALLELAEHKAERQRSEHVAAHGSTAPRAAGAEVSEAAMKREVDLLKRLSDTVGKMLLPMLSTSQPNAAEKKAQEAAAGIKKAIASITSATLAIARWKTSRPEPGSNHPGAIVWEMQLVAKEIFRETRKRPTKRQIRWELEQDGWGIKSKDAEARWAERFRRAGLADLPDWAPP